MRKKYTYKPGSSKLIQFKRMTAEVLRALKKKGPMNVWQLVSASNHAPSTVRQHLAVLEKEGRVGKKPKDEYIYFVIEGNAD